MAEKTGAGGKPQEFDTENGRYLKNCKGYNSRNDLNNLPKQRKIVLPNKIPQLERQDSEIRRIWQIQKFTGFTESEAEQAYNAIKHYTRAGFRAIRDGRAPKEERIIEQFIEKHPKYSGKIWRGIAVNNEEILKNYYAALKSEIQIDMQGISSWSSAESIANEFTDNREGEIKIIFELENQSGVGIDHLSEWQGEEEVLQSGKIRYKVKDIKLNNGKYKIKLEEV